VKKVLLVMMIAMMGCSDDRAVEAVVTAKDGSNGVGIKGDNGNDGESIVGPAGQNGKDGVSAVTPGLSCNVHNLRDWDKVKNILTVLSASAPVGKFILPNLNVGDSLAANGFPGMPANLQSQVGMDGYALDCNGYLDIETSGMYNFSMLSDDGVRLVIDNEVIINSPELQAPTINSSKSVELQRGKRTFNVIYYQGPLVRIALQLKYAGPFTPLQVVPTTKFTH
jgi:PA14 domain